VRASGLLAVAVAVVVASAVAGCGAPRAPSRIIRFESVSHSARLANGLRVLVVEDHATNLVQLGIRLDVGAASDPIGKSGLAHLVEHLMFQVGHDEQGEARPVGADLSAVAIGFNAQTTWEATRYVTVARADQLERLLELEARRFASRCDTISPGTFEREREVVRNELRLHRGFGRSEVDRLVRQIYPREHPYARGVGGNDFELSRLTPEDVCAFFAAHYRPDRMVVVLSGDIAPRPAIGMVARHLGQLRGRSTQPQPFYPTIAARRVTSRGGLLVGNGDDAGLLIAWPMPPAFARDRAAASIATLFLQSELAREDGPGGVMIELGEARAPVTAALIRLPGGAHPSRAVVDRALAAVDRAIARAAYERGPHTIEALVNRRTRELLAEFDQLATRVERLAEGFQLGARDQVFAFELETLDRLCAADVSRAARKLFSRDRAVVVVVEPENRERREQPERASLSYAGKSHDDAWAAPVDARQASEALRVPLPHSTLERAERFRLDSGLEVILLRTRGVPLVSARLVFAGGSADDPPGKEGLAALAAHGLRFPSDRTFRPRDVAAYHALAWFGNDLDVRVEADRTVFSASGLSSHLDVVLSGLASLVGDGDYGGDLPERFRRALLRRDDFDTDIAPPGGSDKLIERHARLRRALYRSVYGASHPYARAADRWLRGRVRISLDDLEGVRTQRFGARNGVLIVTGQFDVGLARQHVGYWFADLRPGRTQVLARPPPAPRSSRVVFQVTTDPTETTSFIEIAYPTSQEPERRAARMVVGRILRERMSRVREVLGAAYSVSASYEDNLGPGMFLISAAVDSRRADEALVTMSAELARLRSGTLPDLDEAFVRARREVLYRVLAEESGAASACDRIASLVQRGENLASHSRLARQVMALTVDDLRPLLATDLASAHEYVGLLGPKESLSAARRAAGM
jgi:zinc protease